MGLLKIFPLFIIFSVILSIPSLGAQIATLKVWVEGDVGVVLEGSNTLIVPLGGKNGTWITVKNIGDIDDTIKLEGVLDSTNEYAKDWIKFSFKCSETVGECDDVPSSYRHEVNNMRITPDINETQFYLEVEAYKRTIEPMNVTMTAYSMTKYKKDSGLKNIEIKIKSSGGWSIRELPGLSFYSIPLVFLIPGIIFYKKMI